jgi:tungstate transport system ATP-binding protein
MIEFEHICLNFGEKEVLNNVSFSINDGEIFTFIGPSGSGKTTILRLIDMLERPTSGRILIDGSDVAKLRDREKVGIRRKMSMVFQKPIPLRGTVYDNIALGLRFRKVDEQELPSRIVEALDVVGLKGYEERNATTLSGGEMQRVAIARAIATKPDVLLLDEPTANLDPVSTRKIENLIAVLKERFHTTVILSTHDMVQGQRLADRMAVLLDGKINQVGTAVDIFYRPISPSVARMVGVENILDGRIHTNENGLVTVAVKGIEIDAVSSLPPSTAVTLFIRPEEITCSAKPSIRSSARNLFTGRVTKVVPIGPMVRLKIDAGEIMLTAVITQRSFEDLDLGLGKETQINFKASAIHVAERLE